MIKGACHCGNVEWELDTHPQSVLSCNCSLCYRQGALWAYGILGKDVTISGAPKAYRRGAKPQIEFMFCPNCGCLTHYMTLNADEDGDRRCAVNLRMAEFDKVADIKVQRFDGRETWSKLPSAGVTVRDVWG